MQFSKLENNFRRRRHSSRDVVLVHSRAEEQLMKFLPPNRHLSVERKHARQSPLNRILKGRESFKEKYFDEIDKTRRNLNRLNKRFKEMPSVRIGDW